MGGGETGEKKKEERGQRKSRRIEGEGAVEKERGTEGGGRK